MIFLAPVIIHDLASIGKDHDGGHVVSRRCLEWSNGMLNIGIGNDWGFDRHWRDLKPLDRIHAYDGALLPGSMAPDLRDRYRDFFGGRAEHFPVDIGSNSLTGQSSFDDAMVRLNRDRVFLKMIFEGKEYLIADDVLSHAKIITGMVIKFHDTNKSRDLFCATIRKYQEFFNIIHIRPDSSKGYAEDNFPNEVEISFINRDIWENKKRKKECYLPDLDQSDLPDADDVVLYWESLV